MGRAPLVSVADARRRRWFGRSERVARGIKEVLFMGTDFKYVDSGSSFREAGPWGRARCARRFCGRMTPAFGGGARWVPENCWSPNSANGR